MQKNTLNNVQNRKVLVNANYNPSSIVAYNKFYPI